MNRQGESGERGVKARSALRRAGMSAAETGSDTAGPQIRIQTSFEASDGVKIRPGLAVRDGGDGRVVNAADRLGSSKAHAVHGLDEVETEPASDLNGRFGAGSIGPVGYEFCGGSPTRPWHVISLEPTSLIRVSSEPDSTESLPTSSDPVHTVDTYHQFVGDLVARAIAEYRPDMPAEDWAVVGPFVRDAVTDCDTKTPYAAKDLMAAASRHAWWCWRAAGLALDRGVVYRREVIGEYIARGCSQMSPASAGNRRSQLLRMSEILLPSANQVAQLPALPPSKALEPYSASELTALRSWASGLNTQYRREQAHLLLALGLGAGLSNAEILAVQAQHVHVDEDGVLIHVEGRRPRTVPVLALWERALIDYGTLCTLNSRQFIFRPRRQSQDSNTIGNFVDRTRPGVVKATSQRMRVTWIVTHLIAGSPLTALIQAAGVESLEALTRYLQFVPGKELTEVRSQFRSAKAGTDLS